MNTFKAITYTLLLIGAINWGLVGLFDFDLVAFLFGDMTMFTRIIYTLVGIAAIGYAIISLREQECVHYHC